MPVRQFIEYFGPSTGDAAPPQWIVSINATIDGFSILNANTGLDDCGTDAMSIGNSVAYTQNAFKGLVDQSWELVYTISGRTPNGRAYFGLIDGNSGAIAPRNFYNWRHCVYITSGTWTTGTPPRPANGVYVYDGSGNFPQVWYDGLWTNNGQKIIFRQIGDFITYLIDDKIIYRSKKVVTYPLEAVVSMCCHNQRIEAEVIYGPNVGAGTGQISPGTQAGPTGSSLWQFTSPVPLPQPSNNSSAPLHVTFREVMNDWRNHQVTFDDTLTIGNTTLSVPIRQFEIVWDGLSVEQATILDQHYTSTRGGISFSMFYPHTGETLSNCRYSSYSRSSHSRYWSQSRQARIIKYPD